MLWSLVEQGRYSGGCFSFKQKTAYEMRIRDWSSDVCSSDLPELGFQHRPEDQPENDRRERVVVPAQHETGDADCRGDEQIDHVPIEAVDTDGAEGQDRKSVV